MTVQQIYDGIYNTILDNSTPDLTDYLNDENCPKDLKDVLAEEELKSAFGYIVIEGGYTVGTRPVRIKGHA